MRRIIFPVWAFFLAVLVVAGCSSSTDPSGGGDAEVVYTPDRQFLDITLPGTLDFSVAPSHSADLAATWVLNGTEVGSGLTYRYTTGTVGADTLRVQTVLDGVRAQRDWLITVLPSASLLPPPVPDVVIQHGAEPMDVAVSWHWISQSAFPLVDYLIATSYEGPVTNTNWDQATLQATVPHMPGQAGYTDTLTAEANGMLPAATLWLAVRGRDNRGQLSPVSEIYRHTISFAWWIEGTALDTEGNPLPEIIIDFGGGNNRDNTDGNGYYNIGPFRDVDLVTIRTYSRNVNLPGEPNSSWYDFRTDPLIYSAAGNTHDLVLVTRYGMDPLCDSYDDEFLTFLRQMTKTDITTLHRSDFRLYRWAEYPVRVYVPEHVRPDDDLDFGAQCRLAAGYWNQVMGEDYLVVTEDPAQAQIEFVFEDLGNGANGRASLAAPLEPEYYGLGDVVPEKIRIQINNVLLPTVQRVQETAMHELGHALGLYEHVYDCGDRPYLMNLTSAGALDDGPLNSVHPDEIRLLNAVRHLPQGTDMASFFLE